MWVYLIELIEMNTVIFVIDFESYDFDRSKKKRLYFSKLRH